VVRSGCGDVAVAVTVQNVGGTTANNVTITTSTLSSPKTDGAPLPRNFGNLAPGQWATTVLSFAGSQHPSGSTRILQVDGSHSTGTFFIKKNVAIP
jgi:hypothetical protein